MLDNLKKMIYKYAYLILPICTLLCLAGFIGSYLFPNEVLDTYEVNMKEKEGDEEFVWPLTGAEDEIGYVMETDGRALKGFQIGISKNGAALTGTELIYRVYGLPDEGESMEAVIEKLNAGIETDGLEMLLEKSYDLGTCLDGQYPYLPFDEEGVCKGRLYITFTYQNNGNDEGVLPGIYANHHKVERAASYREGEIVTEMMGGEEAPVMIKHYYIYSHDTYPLLYDCRVLTFVFLAASMTVCYPKMKKKKEGMPDAA